MACIKCACIPPISLWLVWLVFGHAFLQLNQGVTVGNSCASIKLVLIILVLLESIHAFLTQTVVLVLILLDQSGALGEYIHTCLITTCVVFRCY